MKNLLWTVLALICFECRGVGAQWYSDPNDPIFQLASSLQRPWIVADGLNGAFFTGSTSTGVYARPSSVGHINAAGFLTFAGGVIAADDERFGTFADEGLSLFSSQPPGTVIGVGERFDLDSLDGQGHPARLGIVVAKFDSTGLTGFQRVVTNDGQYGLLHGDVIGNEHGYYAGVPDDQGGIHLVVVDESGSGGGVRYNHLQADGQWSIAWPGELLLGGTSLIVLLPDGYGGAFAAASYLDNDPRYPHVMLQRYDRNGILQFDIDGRLLTDSLSGPCALQAGYLHAVSSRQVQPGLFDYSMLKFDTNAVSLWGAGGHVFISNVDGLSSLHPDRTGGFFYSHHEASGLWTTYRHNSEAELVAQSPPEWTAPARPDGTGGGYRVYTNAGYPDDSTWVSLDRWTQNLAHAWSDSVSILNIGTASDAARVVWTPTDDHAVIGLTSLPQGTSLFRVDMNGNLGPEAAAEPLSELPRQFHIHSVFPNPFNSTTQITFALPQTVHVELQIFNTLGQRVTTLVDEVELAGTHRVIWDGKYAASGLYICQIKAGQFADSKKLLLIQ